eukprot:GHVU01212722.1.p1 GENE.GHVU01212722.1~~GHVU01212722.1.p1  ORF type:complete len:187 (+),score=18.31 GHVU01212722.1:1008-1568(+)
MFLLSVCPLHIRFPATVIQLVEYFQSQGFTCAGYEVLFTREDGCVIGRVEIVISSEKLHVVIIIELDLLQHHLNLPQDEFKKLRNVQKHYKLSLVVFRLSTGKYAETDGTSTNSISFDVLDLIARIAATLEAEDADDDPKLLRIESDTVLCCYLRYSGSRGVSPFFRVVDNGMVGENQVFELSKGI